jgi:hypothetical protein
MLLACCGCAYSDVCLMRLRLCACSGWCWPEVGGLAWWRTGGCRTGRSAVARWSRGGLGQSRDAPRRHPGRNREGPWGCGRVGLRWGTGVRVRFFCV